MFIVYLYWTQFKQNHKLIKILKIPKDLEDQRLDKYLKREFSNLNQSFIEKNLRKKNILVNNQKIKSKYIVKENDEIKIKNFSIELYSKFEKKKNTIEISKIIKKNFDESILYEDDNFIVIDKWSGIATQGGTNITISIDAIIKNISEAYNLVHRLDKETAGLLIIAKNLKYTKIFGNLFKSRSLDKTYLALCEGQPKMIESYVDLAINSDDNKKKIDTQTFYKVLYQKQNISLIKFEPKTGKKHQLRIVAKNLGSPIVGDIKYNLNKSNKNENLKLNAYQLEFTIDDNRYNFTSKLPSDFINFMKSKKIKFDYKAI